MSNIPKQAEAKRDGVINTIRNQSLHNFHQKERKANGNDFFLDMSFV